MHLEIVSPEKTIYNGEAQLVTLPGVSGAFTILERHAPVISVLGRGVLLYRVNGTNNELSVNGGFVEVKKNVVSVVIE
jgi:F-type H+-transporting ATPase subunit epsilon